MFPPLPDKARWLEPADLYALDGAAFALDTETTGLHWWQHKMIGVGIWCPDKEIYGYCPTYTETERDAVRRAVRSWGEGTTIIAHNLKFDFHFMGVSPSERPWDIVDTTEMVNLTDSRLMKNAEACELRYLNTTTKDEYKQVAAQLAKIHGRNVSTRAKMKFIWNWPVSLTAQYCINDCRIEYLFAQKLAPKIEELDMWKLFDKDMEFLKILWETERYGFWVNQDMAASSLALLERHVEDLTQELRDATGLPDLNPNSHQQMSYALYDKLGVERPKNPFADADGVDRSRFKDRGKYNGAMTSTIILLTKVNPPHGHPLGMEVARLRESSKMASTVSEWFNLIDKDSVIHTTYDQTGARTGRISSKDPPLQNIPSDFRGSLSQHKTEAELDLVRTEEYNLRRCFRARPGKILISCDWEQMEMRMFGIRSQDPFMLRALAQGLDIHGEIAEKCWGTRDDAYREWSKMISFGLIYGMTLGSLMFKMDMTHDQAQKIVDDYYATFPRIQPYLHEKIAECQKYGYVRYWSGRIWREDNPQFFYKAANADIQGGCFDVLSVAAIRVNQWIKDSGLQDRVHIVNYIHDEIMLEADDNEEMIDLVVQNLTRIMMLPDLFDIPWFNEPKIGYSYGEFGEYVKPWLVVDSLSAKTLNKKRKKYPQLEAILAEREAGPALAIN